MPVCKRLKWRVFYATVGFDTAAAANPISIAWIMGCVPPFTHTVVQPFAGLSLENLQCRGRDTLLPDRSECNAAELWQTGCRRGFSPAVAAAASLTPSWTHADACPCLFSADTARLAPSGHQRR